MAIGEATPAYLYQPHVPERVAQHLPECRFIVLLRNPVDRAYAQYQMQLRKGTETASFEDALLKEKNASYLKRGYYRDQLDQWLQYFNRNRFLILNSERFFEQPQEVYEQTLTFLNLRPKKLNRVRIYNEGNYLPMKSQTREHLIEHFRGHNQRLYDLLKVDFHWNV